MTSCRVLVPALVASLAVPAAAQNSTRKIRPEPSAEAARAGTAIVWRDTVADALKESAASGKPVFWYVPTVSGSPMDRQVEIDRYMMAGPFSWPCVIAVLTQFFVPVREVPGPAEQERYGLKSGTFIEPGYVVLNGDGSERARLDELTTFHEVWFVKRLVETLRHDVAARAASLVPRQFEADDGDAAREDAPTGETFVRELYGKTSPGALDPANGMTGLPASLDAGAPEYWTWKLAAEREGHGPFRYGFEVPFALPDTVLDAPAVRGTRAPAGAYDADALRACGVRFFAWMQHDDGSFTDSRYDFGGTDSMPNVWTAVTALAGRAMLDVGPRLADAKLREQASHIAEKAFDWCLDEQHLNFADADELSWAVIYRARFARDWLEHRQDRVADAARMMAMSGGHIVEEQKPDGAWAHEYPNPFVTASALIALAELERPSGQKVALKFDHELLSRGIADLKRCLTKDGGVSYYDVPRGAARGVAAGSVGRMPVVHHALVRLGVEDMGALEQAIARAFEFHDEMAKVRKYDDHASRLGYGGFFFWYGMHGRAEAIDALPDGEARTKWKARLREQVLALPEIDGCFVDSHELGRVYGTAMALLCLGDTEP